MERHGCLKDMLEDFLFCVRGGVFLGSNDVFE